MMTLVILNPEFDIKSSGLHFKKGRMRNVSEDEVFYAKRRRGGGETVTQRQVQDPWGPQQSYLKDIFGRAQRQMDIPAYIGPDPLSTEALGLAEQRARAGSPVMRAMQEQLRGTLGGDYLYGGPGFDRAFQAAQNRIIPQVTSQFAKGGRYGSGLAQTAMAQALGDAFANQYAQERQNQMRSMLFAPQAAASDYSDIERLGEIGHEREAVEERRIQDPRARLREYLGLVSGNLGSEVSELTPRPRRGGAGGAAKSALSGATLGAQLGPAGAIIGGIGGGLLGGFL